jgi:hypothetical protein
MSLLGRNHRKINKEQQNFGYKGTRPAPGNRLGGWKSKHSRTRRSHDDRRNLDAAIFGYMINKALSKDTVEAKRIIR